MAFFPYKYSKLSRSLAVLAYIWLIVHSICGVTGRNSRRVSRNHQNIKNKILELQCYALCGDASKDTQGACRTNCMRELVKKPRVGTCPSASTVTLGSMSCLDSCVYDYDCPEVQKCCNSTCGTLCVEDHSVREATSLPPIPAILRTKMVRRHKAVITIQSFASSTYYCHIEVRYHFGVTLSKRKFGPWQWQPVTIIAEELQKGSKKTIEVEFVLKPGRWYQARVAAINANGFRGYSEPSKEFRLPNPPKPPKEPADLQVAAAQFDGKHYRVKVVWCPSKSYLPIEKYKIIWSLYVKSGDDSYISNEAYVKDAHQYEITKLQPDSSYYIQVQAMSINGGRRLKSQLKDLFYSTTLPAAPYKYLNCTQQYHDHEAERERGNGQNINHKSALQQRNINIEKPNLKVHYRMNRKVGMIVQITGLQPYKERVYELCRKDANCEQREYSAIRAKKDSLEFGKLKYNTTYQLKPFKSDAATSDKSSSNTFIFTTPKCDKFKQPHSNMPFKC